MLERRTFRLPLMRLAPTHPHTGPSLLPAKLCQVRLPVLWPRLVVLISYFPSTALCLVSKDFRSVARPWLWRRLEVNIPRNWLGILDTVCGDEEEAENAPNNISAIITENEPEDTRSRAVTKALPSLPDSIAEVLSSSSSAMSSSSESSSDDHGAGPSGWGSVPHDLLTPPASRDPSPARLRLRAASPGRWRFIKAVNKIVHHADPGLYGAPSPEFLVILCHETEHAP